MGTIMIEHDCALGLLEHDPVIKEWVTCEHKVVCHFHSWSQFSEAVQVYYESLKTVREEENKPREE